MCSTLLFEPASSVTLRAGALIELKTLRSQPVPSKDHPKL
jgi:hypothetical protein